MIKDYYQKSQAQGIIRAHIESYQIHPQESGKGHQQQKSSWQGERLGGRWVGREREYNPDRGKNMCKGSEAKKNKAC